MKYDRVAVENEILSFDLIEQISILREILTTLMESLNSAVFFSHKAVT